MKAGITGLVIAKNEAVDLPDCLRDLTALCDQTIVVDNESSDDSAAIARSMGARVLRLSMDEQGYAGLRNAGLDNVDTAQVFILDADERISAGLYEAIAHTRNQAGKAAAYTVRRRNYAFGKPLDHGRFGMDKQIRLIPSTVRYTGLVHEKPVLPEDMPVFDLDGRLEHFTYASIREYKDKMRLYAALSARQGAVPPPLHAACKLALYNLIRLEGYKDGWRGLLMASGDGWSEYLLRRHARLLKTASGQLDILSADPALPPLIP